MTDEKKKIMEDDNSHIHLEDVSRRINLPLRNNKQIKEGFKAIVGSGRPLVMEFNVSRIEGKRGKGAWPFWLGVVYWTMSILEK